MDPSTSTSITRTSRTRNQTSSGWAAFNLKHRENQQRQFDTDPYPPISSSTVSSLQSNGNSQRNYGSSARSFTSVVLPHVVYPNLKANSSGNALTQVGDKVGNKENDDNNHSHVFKKLKERHGWAEDSFIADVLANVGSDIDKASTLLEEMVSIPSSVEKNITRSVDFQFHDMTNSSVHLEKSADLASDITDLSFTLEKMLTDNHKDSAVASELGQLSGKVAANMKLILGHLRSVPLEPEWEEDDVYMIHRKNARKMMRFASQHSRAATNAFLRGDHFAAQHYSLKAREQWLDSEKLNLIAAKEILHGRNSENDPWKLDLHGLHALEAVQALHKHLQKIETQVFANKSAHKNTVKDQKASLLVPSFNVHPGKNLDDKQTTFRQKTHRVLEVITGVGKHSRGQAALPTAIRNFLIENGYRFDEPRPGVITVKPKFRFF